MATGPAAMVAGGAETLVQGLDVAPGQAAQSRGLSWKCWGEVWGLGWGWRGEGRAQQDPAPRHSRCSLSAAHGDAVVRGWVGTCAL